MSLVTLLTTRRDVYRQHTELLFKSIPAITEGILTFLNAPEEGETESIDPVEISWREIEVVEDKLVIVADTKPDPDDNRVHRMTIVLPFELSIDTTPDEVVAFLNNLAVQHQTDDSDDSDVGAVLSPERVLH